MISEAIMGQADDVARMLCERGLSIVVAESSSGGLITAAIARSLYAERCLRGGFVAYSNRLLTDALGVSAALLQSRGCVNANVASQMAEGALINSGAHVALAVCAALRPLPDLAGAPPGLMFMAFQRAKRSAKIKQLRLELEDLHGMREKAIEASLEFLAHSLSATGDKP